MRLEVGLDTVAFIESHYAQERGLSSKNTVDYLNENYINHGKLGTKSSLGGLYAASKTKTTNHFGEPRLVVLDIGLSAASPSMSSGSVIEISTNGEHKEVLAENQSLPDGVGIDPCTGRVFWTNMGVPGKNDGSVVAFDRESKTLETIVPHGTINTPKQLALDTQSKKIYFCDREGLAVYRCNFDGSQLEKIVEAGNPTDINEATDATNWCVGIAVAPTLGKFYWTQKGPSKGNQGRIFSANISLPEGQSPASRKDIECIIDSLPEPIDLEIDQDSGLMYWTDRGEIPFGNSLNRMRLDQDGRPLVTESIKKHEVLTRQFNEAIGLKLDVKNNAVYVTDLGGTIYRCDLDGGHKSVLYSEEFAAFTGITMS